MVRPVFLKKKQNQPNPVSAPVTNTAREKAERLHSVQKKGLEKTPFDGVDDTDNVDPEAEHEAWKQREAGRKERDLGRLRAAEEAKEEATRRKL